MTDQISTSIKIEVEGEQLPRVFVNQAGAREWIEREIQAWNWLGDKPVRRASPGVEQTYQELNAFVLHAKALAHEIERSAPESIGTALAKLQAHLSSGVSNRIFWASDTRRGAYINAIAASDPIVAAFAYRHMRGFPCEVNQNAKAAQGVVLAAMFDADGTASDRATHQAIMTVYRDALAIATSSQTELRDTANQVKQIRQSFEADVEGTFKLMREHRAESEATLTRIVQEVTDKTQKTIQDSESEVKAFLTTYEKGLALQSTVKYWSTKAEEHERKHVNLRWATAIAAVLLAGLLTFELWPFANAEYFEHNSWRLSIPLFHMVLGVWLIRIMVRLMLEQNHLAADANERATMVLAYLALKKEGSGIKEGEMGLIISALFRKATSGAIGDDAAPLAMVTALSRVASGKQN